MATCPACMNPADKCTCPDVVAYQKSIENKIVQHPNSETQSIKTVAGSLMSEAESLEFAMVVFMTKDGFFGHAIGTGPEGAGSGDLLVGLELAKDFVLEQTKNAKPGR